MSKKKNSYKSTYEYIVDHDSDFPEVLKQLGWDDPGNLYIEGFDDGLPQDYLDYDIVAVSRTVWEALVRNRIMQGSYERYLSTTAEGVGQEEALGYGLISRGAYSADWEAEPGHPVPPTGLNGPEWAEPESWAYGAEQADDYGHVTANVVSRWVLDDGTRLVAWAGGVEGREDIYRQFDGYPKLFRA